jgi:hypothetical protein
VQSLSIGTPQRGVGKHLRLDRTTRKIACVLGFIYFLVIFSLSKFSLFTCDIAPSLIYILEGKSSERNFSLFVSLKLGLNYTNSSISDQVCVLS